MLNQNTHHMKRILGLFFIVLPLCLVAGSKTPAESGSSEKQAESEFHPAPRCGKDRGNC